MYSKFIDLSCDRVESRKLAQSESRTNETTKFGNRESVNYFQGARLTFGITIRKLYGVLHGTEQYNEEDLDMPKKASPGNVKLILKYKFETKIISLNPFVINEQPPVLSVGSRFISVTSWYLAACACLQPFSLYVQCTCGAKMVDV